MKRRTALLPSFALAAAFQALRPSRTLVPTGSRSRGSRGQWTSAITCRCASTGPQGSFKRISAASGPPRRTRPGDAPRQSRRCRRYGHGRVRLVRDAVRSRCARRRSLRHRNRQSHGRRRIGEDAIDPPPRCSRSGCASRSHDRAYGDAAGGDRVCSRKPGLRPLARGSLSRLRQWLLAQHRGAARVGRAVDRRLRRRPVDCRTPGRARKSPPRSRRWPGFSRRSFSISFERARFSGKAGPPGCRGDVPGSFRDRQGSRRRSDLNGRATFSARCRPSSRAR